MNRAARYLHAYLSLRLMQAAAILLLFLATISLHAQEKEQEKPAQIPDKIDAEFAAKIHQQRLAALQKDIFAFDPAKPEGFETILKAMRETEMMKSPHHAAFCMGFLIGNFQTHPNNIGTWLKEEIKWDINVRQVVIGAVWLANNAQGNALLKSISKRQDDPLAPIVVAMQKEQRGKIDKMSYAQAQMVQIAWGKYFATRQLSHVETMFLMLQEARTSRALQQVATLPLIEQSITQYAWHDERFYDALTTYLKDKPNPALKDIITQVDYTREEQKKQQQAE